MAGSDYTAISGATFTITGDSLDRTDTVTVMVNDDNIVEDDEDFGVNLSNALFGGASDASRAMFIGGTAIGVGTIENNDSTMLSINDVTMQEGHGGGVTAFTFTVTSLAEAGENISFTVDTADGDEALAGTDYTALVGKRVVLGAGATSTTVTVDVAADSEVEIDETFSITISEVQFAGVADPTSRVTIDDAIGVGKIVNDDSTALSIGDVTMTEGDSGATNFVFTVTSAAAASRNIDFTVNTVSSGEAVAGSDYAKIEAQSERIEIGSTTTEVTVTVIGDTDVELDETFSIVISDALLDGVVNTSLLTISSDDTGVGTIENDDIASFSISDVRAAEGDTGTTSFEFTITTDAVASREMRVQIDTADMPDAMAGVDYIGIVGRDIVIAAGSTSAMVTVDVIGESIVEVNETFGVNLSNVRFDGGPDASRVRIADQVGIGIIENDDGLTIAINDVAVLEGNAGTVTGFEFTISSTEMSSRDIEVTVNTSNFVDAIAGVDYTAIVSETATIVAGQTSTKVTVEVIGDNLVELDEKFSVDLTNARIGTELVIIADSRGVGTILNDEIASLSVDDVEVFEGNSGVVALQFTITSDKTASEAISLTVNTSSVMDALAGTDYAEIVDQKFVIPAGELFTMVTVTAVGDDLVEIDETFQVQLTNAEFDGQDAPTRVVIGAPTGIGTIKNDDSVQLTIDDVTHVEADAGVTNYVFTITSDGLASKDLTVTVNVPDRMDPVGAPDLNAIAAQTATIKAGTLSTIVTVEVLGDLVVERDETFSVNLTAASFNAMVDPSRVDFDDATGIGTIVNNDSLAISIDDVSQTEGDTSFDFTVSIDAIASEDIQVTVNTANGDAEAGADFTGIVNQPAVITAGTSSVMVTVTVTNDNLVENDEDFNVNLSNPLFGGATDPTRATFVGGDANGLGTIVNNDTAVLSINDVSMAEDGTFTFTITSSNPTETEITGTVDTADIAGEALAGSDYTAISGATFTISGDSLDTSDTVTVTVNDDNIVEDDEDFNVNLSNVLFGAATDGTRATLGDASGLGTIVNNDTAVLSINDVSMAEDGTFTFTITSSNPTETEITGTVDTANIAGEALAGSDYTAISGAIFTISGDSLDTSDTVTVTVNDDNIVEDDEDFNVNLSNVLFGGATDGTRATLGDASGLGTIVNNDTAVLSINDVSMAENGTFTFTITSSNPTETEITGTVDTANIAGEALAGSDYTAISGAIFTISGDSLDLSDTVTVTVNDDNIVEDDEDFNVNLSNVLFGAATDGTRATLGDASGLGTIVNNDTAVLSINDVSMAEDGTFTFTITSSNPTETEITGTVDTADITGEAVAGADYTAISGAIFTISGDSLDTSDTVTVTVNDDNIVEDDEDFNVNLSNVLFGGATDGTRATLGDASGLGTIVNNDTAVLSINDVSMAEDGTFTFTITSSNPTETEITGTVDTADITGEAVAGADYTAISGAIFTISGDSLDTSDTVTVTVNDDNIVEDDEDFNVNLSNVLFGGATDGTRATLGDASGLGTIVNNDTAVLSINDVSMAEDGTFTFTITSSNPTETEITGTVDTADITGEAVAGADYTAISGAIFTISGDSLDTSDTVTVTVNDDNIVEDDEDFNVNLSNVLFGGATDGTRATLGDASGLGTIVNNDTAVLSINDVSMAENGTFTFTITSSNPTETEITGTVDTADIAGEALAGSDYTAISGAIFTISGDSLDTSDTVTVTVNDDNIVEDDEDFNVNLSNVLFGGATDGTRATLGDASGLGTIVNNDTAVLSINDVSMAEDGTFTFTITSSNPTETEITGTVDTADIAGEALAGSDYTAISGATFTISGDSLDTSDTVTVTVNDDNIVEDDEDFNVNLSNVLFGGATDGTRATLGDASGLGTIVNNDTAVLSINDVSMAEDGTFTFTITSSNPTETEITGTVDTADIAGEALAGSDYTAISGADLYDQRRFARHKRYRDGHGQRRQHRRG